MPHQNWKASLSYNLPIAGGRIIGFIPFPRVLVLCEMQSISSRIWTRVPVFISYDDNNYATGTSTILCWPHPNTRLISCCLRSQFISASRDQKNSTATFNGRSQLSVFSKSSYSQEHLFWAWRHPHSSPISCRGFIMSNGDCHILCVRA